MRLLLFRVISLRLVERDGDLIANPARSEKTSVISIIQIVMQAKLISLEGEQPVRISKDVTVVGRKRGVCDIYLDRSSVSKLHCLIVKTDGLLFVRDLGSTNGTKVNGQRVTRGALLPGDELSFANAKFRVHLGPDDSNVGHEEGTEVMSMPPPVPGDEEEPLDELGLDDLSESDVRPLDEEED